MQRSVLGALLVAFLLALGAATAQAAVTTVAPASPGIWQPLLIDATGADLPPGDGGATFVTGPPGQPAGVGSLSLVTATGHGNGAALVHSTAFAGTRLTDIRSMSYATYVTQTNGSQLPYVRLTVDVDGNGTPDDQLIFEPVYQRGFALGVPARAPIQLGAWQLWNAREGGWWAVNGVGGASPGAGVKTLDAIAAAAPEARIVNVSPRNGGVSIFSGVVSPADRFDGNVDAFTIDTGSGPTTYDFEPGPPPAVNGTSAIIRAVKGTITVTLPGQDEHSLAALGENVPIGTIVDATRGTAAVTTAVTKRGATQSANFFDGEFAIRQRRGTNAVTDIVLRSTRFARLCGRTTASSARAAAAGEPFVAESAQSKGKGKGKRSKRVVSRLWGDGTGKFRTKGRNSAATVRGTRWLTEERCDGTLTRVRRGIVSVKDENTGKTVRVRAGRSYLAKAP
ncbi:MAG TPA: hypothetical protein VMY78_17615 [Solirubrobacteraceae bacterium]|nr:hypothetical protein [Solirubrobacteraceae bacterium]